MVENLLLFIIIKSIFFTRKMKFAINAANFRALRIEQAMRSTFPRGSR